jgi:hypothetical protein
MVGAILLILATFCEFWAAFIDPSAHLGGGDGLELLLVPLGLMFFLLALLFGAAMPLFWSPRKKQG